MQLHQESLQNTPSGQNYRFLKINLHDETTLCDKLRLNYVNKKTVSMNISNQYATQQYVQQNINMDQQPSRKQTSDQASLYLEPQLKKGSEQKMSKIIPNFMQRRLQQQNQSSNVSQLLHINDQMENLAGYSESTNTTSKKSGYDSKFSSAAKVDKNIFTFKADSLYPNLKPTPSQSQSNKNVTGSAAAPSLNNSTVHGGSNNSLLPPTSVGPTPKNQLTKSRFLNSNSKLQVQQKRSQKNNIDFLRIDKSKINYQSQANSPNSKTQSLIIHKKKSVKSHKKSLEQVVLQTIDIDLVQKLINPKQNGNIQQLRQSQKQEQTTSQFEQTILNKYELVQAYQLHGISCKYRAKLIDWFIQVYRVLRKSTQKTFFQAVSLLDRFIVESMRLFYKQDYSENKEIEELDFHLLGLTCLWISSKLEDVKPVFLKQVLQDAAHNKYTQTEVLAMERKICQVLQFKLNEITTYECTMIALKQFLFNDSKIKFEKQEVEELYNIVTIISYVNTLNVKLSGVNKEQLSQSVISLSLKILAQKYSSEKNQSNNIQSSTFGSQSHEANSNYFNNDINSLSENASINRANAILKKYIWDLNLDSSERKKLQRKEQEISINCIQFQAKYKGATNIPLDFPLLPTIQKCLQKIQL
eukprot:403344513